MIFMIFLLIDLKRLTNFVVYKDLLNDSKFAGFIWFNFNDQEVFDHVFYENVLNYF